MAQLQQWRGRMKDVGKERGQGVAEQAGQLPKVSRTKLVVVDVGIPPAVFVLRTRWIQSTCSAAAACFVYYERSHHTSTYLVEPLLLRAARSREYTKKQNYRYE